MIGYEAEQLKKMQTKILKNYGATEQALKMIEEANELIEAVKGYINGTDTKEHLIEEMGDVENMIDQFKIHLNAWTDVERVKIFKARRQIIRIARGKD